MDLRQRALAVLQTADLASKVAQALVISGGSATLSIANGPLQEPPGVPGRPAPATAGRTHRSGPPRPGQPCRAGGPACTRLRTSSSTPSTSRSTPSGRFDGLPDAYYRDWARVASEEALHFSLLRAHLQSLPNDGTPWDYGSFDAHDGLWAMCAKTSGDVVARMALVPRTLEARGLDASPRIQARLRGVGSPDARRTVEILDLILRDENRPRGDWQPLVPLALRTRRPGAGGALPRAAQAVPRTAAQTTVQSAGPPCRRVHRGRAGRT